MCGSLTRNTTTAEAPDSNFKFWACRRKGPAEQGCRNDPHENSRHRDSCDVSTATRVKRLATAVTHEPELPPENTAGLGHPPRLKKYRGAVTTIVVFQTDRACPFVFIAWFLLFFALPHSEPYSRFCRQPKNIYLSTLVKVESKARHLGSLKSRNLTPTAVCPESEGPTQTGSGGALVVVPAD